MSIHDKRFIKAINKILREELQQGNLPSSKEFIWKVTEYLQQNSLSRASLNFAPVREEGTATADEYNSVLEKLYDDFDTLYVSAIEQQNQSIKHFNKFEVEKSKLDYELKSLENTLKEMILLYGETGFLNSVYDIFTDMSTIDISKTTTSVDIGRHEVRINDIKQTSKKISVPTSVAFRVNDRVFLGDGIIGLETISGTPADALNDKANSVWQTQVLTKKSVAMPAYYFIQFESVQEINRIVLSLQNIKPIFVRVEATEDNINWFKLPYYEQGVTIKDNYTFDFPTVKIARIRILLAKAEPDNETLIKVNNQDEVRQSYIFGMKNISFYRYVYATESDLYSTVLDADPTSDTNFTIDKVSLVVEEELPNGTDIRYYIALPPASGEPEWKAISPVNRMNPRFDQFIDFKNISTSVPNIFSINPAISIGEYELENLYAHGIRFYKIGEIVDRKLINGTEKLFVGKNTWGIKSFTKEHSDHLTHLPSLEDWMNPPQVKMSYSKIDDGKPGIILNKQTTATATNYMFTLGVFSAKAKDIATTIPASIDPIAIYMNGDPIFRGIPNASSKVNFLFKDGWNEIMVLSYTNRSTGTVNGATIDINFDPRSYGSKIYSQSSPLEKVSIFDLRYNVMNNDFSKFALIEVNNKTQVVLNNVAPGLEYEFYYNYIDGTIKDKILFKTTLMRDDSITQASPKLKSYRLRFS